MLGTALDEISSKMQQFFMKKVIPEKFFGPGQRDFRDFQFWRREPPYSMSDFVSKIRINIVFLWTIQNSSKIQESPKIQKSYPNILNNYFHIQCRRESQRGIHYVQQNAKSTLSGRSIVSKSRVDADRRSTHTLCLRNDFKLGCGALPEAWLRWVRIPPYSINISHQTYKVASLLEQLDSNSTINPPPCA